LGKKIDDAIEQTLAIGKHGIQNGKSQENSIAKSSMEDMDGGFPRGQLEHPVGEAAHLQKKDDGEEREKDDQRPAQQYLLVYFQGGDIGDDQERKGDVEDDPGDARFDLFLDDIESGGNQSDEGKNEKNQYLLNDDVDFHGPGQIDALLEYKKKPSFNDG
jgi:hypothetical protein